MSERAQRIRKYSRQQVALIEIETYSSAPWHEAEQARQQFLNESSCADGCCECWKVADELWIDAFCEGIKAQVEFWFGGKILC